MDKGDSTLLKKPKPIMDPVKKYRIYMAALSANMAYFSLGTVVGWSSPTIPRLRDHTWDSPLEFPVSTAQEGWISSLVCFGSLMASPVAGPLAGRIGRKLTLLSSSIFFTASYILLMVGGTIPAVYVARLFQGLASGISATVMPMYIGEIATDDCRGAVGSLMTLLMAAGILYVYIIGPFVSYITLQWCCIVMPITFFATFIFMPESPYYYAIKGQTKKARNALQFLRGQSAKAVEEELHEIQVSVDKDMSNTGTLLDIFQSRGYRKALLICGGLLMFQQFSGTTAVLFNSQSIFSAANSALDPALATIIMGFVQLAGNLLTPFVVERTGRKMILLTSATGMCVALLGLGTFFYVQTFGDPSSILWIPIPALLSFNAFYAFGFGPIPWAIVGEMFPSNIKPVATSFVSVITSLVSFIVTRWYPELNALGSYYAFWFFGFCCILAFLFTVLVVIETKGLSLETIQAKLHSRRRPVENSSGSNS
ncbi:facilitated trehalose transporter Tret1-like isoform X2 [Eupeodes corollae]|nr:facilitated trehalose transporter Tret1-like isoform X2 [Eupeodes corollae]XP_055907754.1 facilitated trehalose transporter Tret1-like isoform X2 [Eupeodes corollae]